MTPVLKLSIKILILPVVALWVTTASVAQSEICSNYRDTISQLFKSDYPRTLLYYDSLFLCYQKKGDITGYLNIMDERFYNAFYSNEVEDMRAFIGDYDSTLAELEHQGVKVHKFFIESNHLIHILYNEYIGDYKTCIELAETQFPYILAYGHPCDHFRNRIRLAAHYEMFGRYQNANQCLLEAYDVAKNGIPLYKENVMMALLKLFHQYQYTFGDPEKADATLKELKSLEKEIAQPYGDMAILYPNLYLVNTSIFEYYCTQQERDSACKYLQLAIQFSGHFGQGLTNIEKQLAHYYQLTGLTDSALYYYQAHITKLQKQYGEKKIEVAQAWLEEATYYAQNKEWLNALNDIQTALIAIPGKFEDHDYHHSPVFEATTSPKDLFLALKLKTAVLFRLSETTQGDYLATAYATAAETIRLIDKIRGDYQSDFDKTYLIESGYSIYEQLIAAALKLQQQTGDFQYGKAAFAAAEKSRSIALFDAHQLSEVEKFLSPEDRERLYSLRAKLTAGQNKMITIPMSDPDWSLLQQEYSNVRHELRDFMDNEILIKYPDYHQRQYETAQTGVAEVQAALAPGQSLLQYFTGDSAITAFVITQDTFVVKVIPLTFPLENRVQQFRYYMDELHYMEGADKFVSITYQLYEQLLSPLESLLTPKVIIAADGILNYLPFEALITRKPLVPSRFKDHIYFLNRHEVSYCFSASLMIKTSKQYRSPVDSLTLSAFAPFYEGDSLRFVYDKYAMRGEQLDSLPGSGEETFRVSRLWNGIYYWGKSATKQCFTATVQKADILLLSTHGKSEGHLGDYSWLAFSRPDSSGYELLYADEIINLKLHATLVFLSACETGMGKIRRGEGVISLARAFTYAGAKSVITTLWSVNDGGTRLLVIDFFSLLHQGMTNSEALRSAKLRQIQQEGVGSHPYFWAGFVGLGD
jgi:hypothetical protein